MKHNNKSNKNVYVEKKYYDVIYKNDNIQYGGLSSEQEKKLQVLITNHNNIVKQVKLLESTLTPIDSDKEISEGMERLQTLTTKFNGVVETFLSMHIKFVNLIYKLYKKLKKCSDVRSGAIGVSSGDNADEVIQEYDSALLKLDSEFSKIQESIKFGELNTIDAPTEEASEEMIDVSVTEIPFGLIGGSRLLGDADPKIVTFNDGNTRDISALKALADTEIPTTQPSSQNLNDTKSFIRDAFNNMTLNFENMEDLIFINYKKLYSTADKIGQRLTWCKSNMGNLTTIPPDDIECFKSNIQSEFTKASAMGECLMDLDDFTKEDGVETVITSRCTKEDDTVYTCDNSDRDDPTFTSAEVIMGADEYTNNPEINNTLNEIDTLLMGLFGGYFIKGGDVNSENILKFSKKLKEINDAIVKIKKIKNITVDCYGNVGCNEQKIRIEQIYESLQKKKIEITTSLAELNTPTPSSDIEKEITRAVNKPTPPSLPSIENKTPFNRQRVPTSKQDITTQQSSKTDSSTYTEKTLTPDIFESFFKFEDLGEPRNLENIPDMIEYVDILKKYIEKNLKIDSDSFFDIKDIKRLQSLMLNYEKEKLNVEKIRPQLENSKPDMLKDFNSLGQTYENIKKELLKNIEKNKIINETSGDTNYGLVLNDYKNYNLNLEKLKNFFIQNKNADINLQKYEEIDKNVNTYKEIKKLIEHTNYSSIEQNLTKYLLYVAQEKKKIMKTFQTELKNEHTKLETLIKKIDPIQNEIEIKKEKFKTRLNNLEVYLIYLDELNNISLDNVTIDNTGVLEEFTEFKQKRVEFINKETYIIDTDITQIESLYLSVHEKLKQTFKNIFSEEIQTSKTYESERFTLSENSSEDSILNIFNYFNKINNVMTIYISLIDENQFSDFEESVKSHYNETKVLHDRLEQSHNADNAIQTNVVNSEKALNDIYGTLRYLNTFNPLHNVLINQQGGLQQGGLQQGGLQQGGNNEMLYRVIFTVYLLIMTITRLPSYLTKLNPSKNVAIDKELNNEIILNLINGTSHNIYINEYNAYKKIINNTPLITDKIQMFIEIINSTSLLKSFSKDIKIEFYNGFNTYIKLINQLIKSEHKYLSSLNDNYSNQNLNTFLYIRQDKFVPSGLNERYKINVFSNNKKMYVGYNSTHIPFYDTSKKKLFKEIEDIEKVKITIDNDNFTKDNNRYAIKPVSNMYIVKYNKINVLNNKNEEELWAGNLLLEVNLTETDIQSVESLFESVNSENEASYTLYTPKDKKLFENITIDVSAITTAEFKNFKFNKFIFNKSFVTEDIGSTGPIKTDVPITVTEITINIEDYFYKDDGTLFNSKYNVQLIKKEGTAKIPAVYFILLQSIYNFYGNYKPFAFYDQIDTDSVKINNIPENKSHTLVDDFFLKNYESVKNYFSPINKIRRVSGLIFEYDQHFVIGPVTKIFKPINSDGKNKTTNKDIVNEMAKMDNNIIDDLVGSDDKPSKNITLIGYGASGSGKTSTLVWWPSAPKEDQKPGVLIHICNNAKVKNKYKRIEVQFVEYMVKPSVEGNPIYDRLKDNLSTMDTIDLSDFYKSTKEYKEERNENYSIKMKIPFKLKNGANISMESTDTPDPVIKIINNENLDYYLRKPSIDDYVKKLKAPLTDEDKKKKIQKYTSSDKWKKLVTDYEAAKEELKNTKYYFERTINPFMPEYFEYDKDGWYSVQKTLDPIYGYFPGNLDLKINVEFNEGKCPIGSYIEKMMEQVREINPTTNNPQSSRSHMLIFLKFFDEKQLTELKQQQDESFINKVEGPFFIKEYKGLEEKYKLDNFGLYSNKDIGESKSMKFDPDDGTLVITDSTKLENSKINRIPNEQNGAELKIRKTFEIQRTSSVKGTSICVCDFAGVENRFSCNNKFTIDALRSVKRKETDATTYYDTVVKTKEQEYFFSYFGKLLMRISTNTGTLYNYNFFKNGKHLENGENKFKKFIDPELITLINNKFNFEDITEELVYNDTNDTISEYGKSKSFKMNLINTLAYLGRVADLSKKEDIPIKVYPSEIKQSSKYKSGSQTSTDGRFNKQELSNIYDHLIYHDDDTPDNGQISNAYYFNGILNNILKYKAAFDKKHAVGSRLSNLVSDDTKDLLEKTLKQFLDLFDYDDEIMTYSFNITYNNTFIPTTKNDVKKEIIPRLMTMINYSDPGSSDIIQAFEIDSVKHENTFTYCLLFIIGSLYEKFMAPIKKNAIVEICRDRVIEGVFINAALNELKDMISIITNKLYDPATVVGVPQFDNTCISSQCPLFGDCFGLEKANTLRKEMKNSAMIDGIEQKISCNSNTGAEKCIYNMKFCLFLVLNLSQSPTTNNPPPSPYIDTLYLEQEYKRVLLYDKYKVLHKDNIKDTPMFAYTKVLKSPIDNTPFDLETIKQKYYTQKVGSSNSELEYTNENSLMSLLSSRQRDDINGLINSYRVHLNLNDIAELIKMLKEINGISSIGTLEYLDVFSKNILNENTCRFSNLKYRFTDILPSLLNKVKNITNKNLNDEELSKAYTDFLSLYDASLNKFETDK
jgi:hypothetical protein